MASIDKLDPPSYLSDDPASRGVAGRSSRVARFDFTGLKQTQIRSEVGVGSVRGAFARRGGAPYPVFNGLTRRVDRERALNVQLGS